MRSLGRVSLKALVVGLVCVGCTAKAPRRHYEKAGKFSYDPPPAWQIIEFPGLKYRISHGPRDNEFAPNINVVDETFSGTLAEYTEKNLANMRKVFRNMKVLSRDRLQTQDGQAVLRIVTENEQQGRPLRQTYHFFGADSRKYVMVCTALADNGEALDAVFEESVKTFRSH